MVGVLLLPEFPQGSPTHTGRLQSPMTVTSLMTVIPLLTDMAGNTPFLIYIYICIYILNLLHFIQRSRVYTLK